MSLPPLSSQDRNGSAVETSKAKAESLPPIVESQPCPEFHIDVQVEGEDEQSIELILRSETLPAPQNNKINEPPLVSNFDGDLQGQRREVAKPAGTPSSSRDLPLPTGTDEKLLNQTIALTSHSTTLDRSEISFDDMPSMAVNSWDGDYDDENSFLNSPRGFQWLPSPTSAGARTTPVYYRRSSTPLELTDTGVDCSAWSAFKSSPICDSTCMAKKVGEEHDNKSDRTAKTEGTSDMTVGACRRLRFIGHE